MHKASKNEIKPMESGSWCGLSIVTDGNIAKGERELDI